MCLSIVVAFCCIFIHQSNINILYRYYSHCIDDSRVRNSSCYEPIDECEREYGNAVNGVYM